MKNSFINTLPFENYLPEGEAFAPEVERGKTESHENRLAFSSDEGLFEGNKEKKA